MRPSFLAVTAALVLVTGCDSAVDDTQGARPGTLIFAPTASEGVATFVQLPMGRVDLTIGGPRQDLPVYDERYDGAAEGASLVAVGWNWDFVSAVPGMADPTEPEVEPSFTLVVDDREYSLDEAMLTRFEEDPVTEPESPLKYGGSVYVAVAGEPSEPRELSISVEYDGLTQVIDPTDESALRDNGAAQSLYRAASALAALPVACDDPAVPQPFVLSNPTCQVSVARLPYVQGVGWAPAGADWVVVDLSTYGGSSAQWTRGEEVEVYLLEEEQGRFVTVDGADPVDAIDADQDGVDERLVFPAATAGQRLVIDTSFTTSGSGGGATPNDPTVPARWTVDLPR